MKNIKKQTIFLILFAGISFLAWQIPINQIVGSEQKFTLFETIAPIGGIILGPFLGAISALIVRLINITTSDASLDFLTLIRFLPMMLAAIYFGAKSKKLIIIPIVCIILFNLHPIGRQAWPYSMLWLIPIVAIFFKKRLISNSIGATFTAHAAGSVIFLYAFQLTPAIWLSLIPVVFLERGFFALGIFINYLAINNLLNYLMKKFDLPILKKLVNSDYLVSKKFIKNYS